LPPQKQLNLINETLIYKFVWLQTKQIACPVECDDDDAGQGKHEKASSALSY